MLLHASFGFEVWQIDRASADLPRTRQSAEYKMSHSRFGSRINEVQSLNVFAKISFPEICDAKNAMAAMHSSPDARGIIQISLYYIGPSLPEKFRGFRVRTACHAPYLDRASFQEMTRDSTTLHAGCADDQNRVSHRLSAFSRPMD
jgi:hypothetical protein